MKITSKHFFIFILNIVTLPILFSCREPLISSSDERKEQLIQGSWIYYTETGSISLTFNPDFTVDIVNSLDTNVYTFSFRIEDGELYFLQGDDYQQVEFTYTIESLTSSELVLSFVGIHGFVRQTYVRP